MIVPIQDIKKPQTAKQFWRSASQIANTAKFQDWMHREFPVGASELPEGSSRRNLLKFMGATLALAGLTACRRPEEKIYPLVHGAEDLVPGKPVYYNSVFSMSGTAAGVMVETHDGRPTKIEGNVNHPHSLGAASTFAQASILGLYDPDRIAKHTKDGAAVEWEEFVAAVPSLFAQDGAKVRFLSQRVSSPSYARLRAETLKKFPGARWVEYEPIQADGVSEGARIAFGRPVTVNYNFEPADVVVALDFDFLGLDGSTLLNARQWAARRRVRDSHHAEMNRVYVAESQFSVTGGAADHRVRLRASDILAFTTALAAKLGIGVSAPSSVPGGEAGARVLEVLAKDLQAHQGKSLVAAGPRQPAAVHALALLINQTLGNIGSSVQLHAASEAVSEIAQLKQLTDDLNAGAVETLVVVGGNPVFDAPADFAFGSAYSKAANRIYHGEDNNETAAASNWVLQAAHFLESWGDSSNFDGVAAVQQPMILPLFDGKSPLELLAVIAGAERQRGYEIVQDTWFPTLAGDKDKAWRKIVHDGVIPGTAAPTLSASVNSAAVLQAASAAPAASTDGMELVFVPSSHCYDGRFNNNAWLQEAPDPVTKLTWDNAAFLSKATAEKLGIADDIFQLETTTPAFTSQLVSIRLGDAEVKMPVLIQPGHADDSITLTLGFGREKTGQVGEGTGFNVYPLRKSSGLSIATGATVTKASGRYELASTQDHGSLTDALRTRTEIVREITLEEFQKDHHAFQHIAHEHPEFQLYESPKYESPYQWGMTVDLNTCFGCNACLVACQSENNVPTVGKSQVLMGREMHWVRMDRYYTGSVEEAQMVAQPMSCQHCETAPCENVCPVAATVHGPDGTNQMAYNRCVGTRYCSNNCPYKVRRFNFFDYHNKRYDWFTLGNKAPEIASLQYNPNVTVRERGIMEKCTYCVQRIAQVRIQAKTENREIRDGEIQTACQQTCPAQAIEFGNVADPNSRVSQAKKLDANYAVLQELNVRPRTTYLGRLRNPHPELV